MHLKLRFNYHYDMLLIMNWRRIQFVTKIIDDGNNY